MDKEKNNNVDKKTPSTDSNVMPSGGSTLGQAAKQGAKKTAQKGWESFKEAVGRGIKALWQLLPIQVKIIVIVILCICIILAALLLMGMIKESSSVVSNSVDNYISNASDLDKDAKSLYEDKSSLIKVKLEDINSMYDKFINDGKGGAETQTLMKYSIGKNEVKDDKKENRIVDVDDKLPLYKHILLTEKYNFNSVEWIKFSHTDTAGGKVKDYKEDKEKGVKYPDTTKNNAGDPKEVKLDKFIDLTLPYLQTWYIPLAMSNASVLNGIEEDNNRAPAFSYNIIKEAYSNIVVNWYEVKKHTTVTRYHTYDEVKKHDMVTVEVIEREYEDGYKNYSLSFGSSQTLEDSRTPKNTRTTSGIAGDTVDPMKEEAVSQKDEYTSSFYIKEADVFDAKIINQFNYQIYSDSDAAKRKNADSTNESTAKYAKTMSIEDINKKAGNAMYGLTVDKNGNLSGANVEKIVSSGKGIPQNDPTNTTKRTTAYPYIVTFKQYTDYENGLEHTVTRIWKDKLSQTGSETSDYTIDDLIAYNQSDKRNKKVDATDLCGENYSSSSSSGTSTGTSNPATEIKIGDYTYPVFNQGSYPYTTKHGGDTISQAGCGLCSLTVCVGGLTGKKVDPVSCGNDTNWVGPKTLAGIAADLRNVYNIDAEALRWDNRTAGGTTPAEKASLSKTKITEALKNNSPVIALIKPIEAALGTSANGAHYITLVGLNGNKVIIANSAGGLREEYDLDWVIEKIYENANTTECGIVVTKRSGASSSSSSSSDNNSSSSGKMIFIGDSRIVGMYNSVEGKANSMEVADKGSNETYWVGKVAQGLSWFKSTGMSKAKSNITSGTNVVVMLGVNDLGNANDYVSTLNSYANEVESKGGHLYFVSVLPMQESKNSGYSVNNNQIEEFNKKVKSGLSSNVQYIDIYNDTNNKLNSGEYGTVDGLHYDASTYKKLYNVVRVKMGSTSSSSSGSSSSSDITCTGTKSGKYYTALKKTDGLNRIDFMNSNPDIFHRYIRDGGEYHEYVGYSRAKLKLSYWNLKDLFQKVYDKHGSLPWSYGKTLGFEDIYSSKSSSSPSSQGGMFIWPVPEYVEAGLSLKEQLTATFAGDDSVHNGNHGAIDIAHGVNTSAKIVAAAAGEVIKAGDTGDGYGNCVIIKHSNGYFSLYGHMAPGSLLVSEGDNVKQGQQIGTMGTTGNSTGNHLHFEVRTGASTFWASEKVDPEQFFKDDCSPIGGGSSSVGLNLTVDQIKDFAVMIYGEAGGNSYELQVACAAAAINQYKAAKEAGKDVDFLEDFIHDTSNFNGYGAAQGHQVSENDSVYKAAVDALNGEDPTGGALYFYAPAAMPGGTSAWHESLTYLCTIDGVKFFKP